jgi:maltooligosyltrehalose trehalohydrolase
MLKHTMPIFVDQPDGWMCMSRTKPTRAFGIDIWGFRMIRTNGNAPVRRTGAIPGEDGSILWRVWAPLAQQVDLILVNGEERRNIAMEREDHGFHRTVLQSVPEGQRYAYLLDGGPARPDPCSLWQPEGVDGFSAVVIPDRFSWTDQNWKGIRQAELVLYELHVGTFTALGTFEAIIPRLRDLQELGVTAIEIMPVAQFPGSRNWGYDGVLLYAAQNTYGGPHGLQRLVDACHACGLAVYLDVVYNHFGPESNYLGEFGPYFTDCYKTPWGPAVNYDRAGCDAVRDFVLDNVRMWLEEFHVDGLRLDAVDAIFDMGARHILRAIKEAANNAGASRGWPAIVTAESDLNDPRLLYPVDRGGHELDAQWMDDYHHAVHAFFTHERDGYYSDYGKASQLAEVLERPFLYNWNYSAFRDRKHGARPEGLGCDRFVVCLQNHDQVGNRASGDRLNTLLDSRAAQRLAASYFLLSPYLLLLFMGEEYGEETPFPFFCSFRGEELRKSVSEGRRREYSAHDQEALIPDPGAEATFRSAQLSWSWPEGSVRHGLRRLYRDLLSARREWPALLDLVCRSARLVNEKDDGLLLEARLGSTQERSVRAVFNLAERPRALVEELDAGQSILFTSEAEIYHGGRTNFRRVHELLPHECLVFGPSSWRSFT